MLKTTDLAAVLPNGQMFDFWEVPQEYDREIHVNNNHPNASDDNDGTLDWPFKTINAAAQVAKPGTRVLIHRGVYRETVQPAKGGLSPSKVISYEAFEGEEVIIKASVEVKNFKPSTGWRLTRDLGKSRQKQQVLKFGKLSWIRKILKVTIHFVP